jgi:Ribonuclease G/E
VKQILASCGPGETRVAVCDGDLLVDFAIDRPGSPDGVGDIYVGRAASRVPSMAGVFVELASAEGFLPDSDGGAALTEGALLMVRVTRAAQGGKGPRLAAATPGAAACDGPVRLLKRGPAALMKLAALHPAAPLLIDDALTLAPLRPALGQRLRLVPRAFDDALEAEIEGLQARNVSLPGRMTASIVPTPALTAIDLDGGSATADRGAKAGLQLAMNRAAIPALARQIRLRNLGGAILIDFAGMPARKRTALAPALEQALAGDPAKPRLLGFTQLGLAEILRPRIHPPLHEMMSGPLACGLAALRHAADTASRDPARRLALRASPAIISALQADAHALDGLERRLSHPMMLQADPSLGRDAWTLEDG